MADALAIYDVDDPSEEFEFDYVLSFISLKVHADVALTFFPWGFK